MTRLIARLILAMLLLPLTGAIILLMMVTVVLGRGGPPGLDLLLVMWALVYLFIACYWLLLWRSVVRWTASRLRATIAAGLGALLAGLFAVVLVNSASGEIELAVLIGGGVPPIVWVLATVLIWRETPQERMGRLAGTGTVSCPICGYNMTGLREARCPECGASMTLEELVGAQPQRDAARLPDE